MLSDMLRISNRTEIRELILVDLSDIFNFCADQEWQSTVDPSQKNLAYAMCQYTLEDYLQSASNN
jgi:uncharacterized membrane protein